MNFIISKEQYLSIKARWSETSNCHSAKDHIIYNVLRGFPLDRGFSPVTDSNKLANGAEAWQAFTQAKSSAAFQFREIMHYEHDNADRKLRNEKAFAERIDSLNKQYGIEFTPELRATIREALK